MNRLPRRPVLPLNDCSVLGDDVRSRFVFEGVVGRGTYGTVFKVASKSTKQVRAVKENNIGKAGDGFTRDAGPPSPPPSPARNVFSSLTRLQCGR